ncbi:hypothetical protein M407DRAFT_70028, partial [Tulasnella calospora MUT 4182]
LRGHDNMVWSVCFSPNGKLLASGSGDSTIRLWDVETGAPIGEPLRGHDNEVLSVCFSPNGKLLASTSAGTVETGFVIKEHSQFYNDLAANLNVIAVSPDCKNSL